jgi:hypothetical protein
MLHTFQKILLMSWNFLKTIMEIFRQLNKLFIEWIHIKFQVQRRNYSYFNNFSSLLAWLMLTSPKIHKLDIPSGASLLFALSKWNNLVFSIFIVILHPWILISMLSAEVFVCVHCLLCEFINNEISVKMFQALMTILFRKLSFDAILGNEI